MKSLIPRAPEDAVFRESGCSGFSLRSWFTQLGGAGNCLLVYVQGDTLVVTPQFPFNLFFFLKIYDLDRRVPLAMIASVSPQQIFFRRVLRLDFAGDDLSPVALMVHDEAAFVRALGASIPVSGNRQPQAPKKAARRYRMASIRLFFGLWGTLALLVSGPGLLQDCRYRIEGIAAAGSHWNGSLQGYRDTKDGAIGYSVKGQYYRLPPTNLGSAPAGDADTVYYLPTTPGKAREASLLYPDLFFSAAGLLALFGSLFAGRLLRRFSPIPPSPSPMKKPGFFRRALGSGNQD